MQIVCVGKDHIVIQIVCASEILNLLMPSLQNFITSPQLLSGNVVIFTGTYNLYHYVIFTGTYNLYHYVIFTDTYNLNP
jgi:uncharacterized protein YfaT (DUF1175 family)